MSSDQRHCYRPYSLLLISADCPKFALFNRPLQAQARGVHAMASGTSWHAHDSWHDVNLSPELQHSQIQRSRGCTTGQHETGSTRNSHAYWNVADHAFSCLGNYVKFPEPPSSPATPATASQMQSDILNNVHIGKHTAYSQCLAQHCRLHSSLAASCWCAATHTHMSFACFQDVLNQKVNQT